MDKSRIPLAKWFWAIYMVGTDKRGCSATALSNKLDISYKAAWYLLKRLQMAMMERDWDYMLSGTVEVDDVFFGSADEGGKRGRGTDKTQVIVGLSLNEKGGPQYLKMESVNDLTKNTVGDFTTMNIVSGSTISTDAYSSYKHLRDEGYDHQPKIYNPKDDSDHLKWLHTIVSNAKAFINGTYHGLDKKHLDYYLAEFCYRFNRRFDIGQLFSKLLYSCVAGTKISYAELTA
jgi:transposase-like protein